MDPNINMIITLAVQLALGKLIKSNPKLANGIIFWANWLAGIITNLSLNALLPAPVHAATAGSVAHSVGSTIFLNPFVLSFIQSIFATGIHSATKNTWEGLKKFYQIGTP